MYTFLFTTHSASWLIMILLFLVTYFLIRAQKGKISTILSMVLRLFYIIMLVSGIGMLINKFMELGFIGSNFIFALKGILAVMLIGMMEAILGRTKRREQTAFTWIAFVILLVAVVLLGFLKL